MVNTKTHFNNLKMQIFRGNDPIGDDRWQALNLDDMAATATGSGTVGSIRDVIDIFDYMNHPELYTAWGLSANGIRAVWTHFQDCYNMNVSQGAWMLANLPGMWNEYVCNVLIPQIENNVEGCSPGRVFVPTLTNQAL